MWRWAAILVITAVVLLFAGILLQWWTPDEDGLELGLMLPTAGIAGFVIALHTGRRLLAALAQYLALLTVPFPLIGKTAKVSVSNIQTTRPCLQVYYGRGDGRVATYDIETMALLIVYD
jgi:hypothetical protein